ncbi:MAG: hypothetical protein ABL894_10570 [Hyphomicrobium sp.]
MLLSRETYLSRLRVATGISLAVAGIVYVLAPARWFSFYGWAVILLVAVTLFAHPLLQRLKDLGQNRAWALAFIVPGALAGLLQIGFWLVFFVLGPRNPVPGIAREMFWINAGFAMPYAIVAVVAVWLWLLTGAAREPG